MTELSMVLGHFSTLAVCLPCTEPKSINGLPEPPVRFHVIWWEGSSTGWCAFGSPLDPFKSGFLDLDALRCKDGAWPELPGFGQFGKLRTHENSK